MRKNDAQLGRPEVLYKDTQANTEALTGIDEGAIAYATDTHELGAYNGSAWIWGSGTAAVTTHYEPLAFNDEVLIFNHDVLMMEVAN